MIGLVDLLLGSEEAALTGNDDGKAGQDVVGAFLGVKVVSPYLNATGKPVGLHPHVTQEDP